MTHRILTHESAARKIESQVELVWHGATVPAVDYFVSYRSFDHQTHWQTPATKVGTVLLRVGGSNGIILQINGVSLAAGRPCTISPSALLGDLTINDQGVLKLVFTAPRHTLTAEFRVGSWSAESGIATIPAQFIVPRTGSGQLRVHPLSTTIIDTSLVRACTAFEDRVVSASSESSDDHHEPDGAAGGLPSRPAPDLLNDGPMSGLEDRASPRTSRSGIAAERPASTAAERGTSHWRPAGLESTRMTSPANEHSGSESSTFLMSSPIRANGTGDRYDTASDASDGRAHQDLHSVNLLTESSVHSDRSSAAGTDWGNSSVASEYGLCGSRSHSPVPRAACEPLVSRTVRPGWRIELFYQQGYRFGAPMDEQLQSSLTIVPEKISIEKEVIELALGGARSSKDVHEIFAHTPATWARQYDGCLHDLNGQRPTIGAFTCGPCDRQTDEFLIPVDYAPVNEFPGEVLSSCLIEIYPGVRRRIWADSASGYLLMGSSLPGRTFPTIFAEIRSDIETLPGAKASTREIYLDEGDRQAATDAAQMKVVLNYSHEIPPFVKVGGQCYRLQNYVEGRLRRFLAATPTGSANMAVLLEYMLHQHNVAQVDDLPSPTLQLTGRVDDRIWRPIQDPVDAFVDGRWKKAQFAGWPKTTYQYLVCVDGQYRCVSSIRPRSEE